MVQRCTRLAGVWMAVGLMMVSVAVWAGPKWELTDDGDSWMQLSFLGQVHGSYLETEDEVTDVYLRRARVILAGQVTDGVKFFVETDNDNAGKRGTGPVRTDIQDAFVDYRIGRREACGSELWAQAGLLLLPFSFENHSSAASLLGLDYNSETIKFVNHFVWRDYGAQLHGNIGKRVSYIVGAFDGYDDSDNTKNPDADVRVTGHMALNILGAAETGWFYSQDRQGKPTYLSLGAGIDTQSKATLTPAEEELDGPTIEDHDAWVVDMQAGFNICEDPTLTVNGSYFDWDNASFKGNTAFVESGLRVQKTMMSFKYSLQDPDAGEDVRDYTAGLHYFTKGHNARGGIEYRWGDNDEQVLVGLQFLL
jgi:hypothetical protein